MADSLVSNTPLQGYSCVYRGARMDVYYCIKKPGAPEEAPAAAASAPANEAAKVAANNLQKITAGLSWIERHR